ncbi:MAG TPA: amidohydrolase family protein [Gaiellaceae bacterium]|nr:amidohydrolase family protein [Gaiellaceae bacterium]
MTSFDVHQHLWPEQLVAALRRRNRPPRIDGDELVLGEGTFEANLQQHDLDTRLGLLDAAGIDVAIVSLQPTLACDGIPELVDAYHDGILELIAAAGGRLRAFAVAECRDGFAGACVAAPSVVAGLEPLAEELVSAGQTLFVHPGPVPSPPSGSPAWWPALVDYPAQMQAAYAAWLVRGRPDLSMVFGFLAGGGPFQLERLRARGGDVPALSVYFDTASYGPLALRLTEEACGAGCLVFGSDAPVMDTQAAVAAVEAAGVAEKALRENPQELFA